MNLIFKLNVSNFTDVETILGHALNCKLIVTNADTDAIVYNGEITTATCTGNILQIMTVDVGNEPTTLSKIDVFFTAVTDNGIKLVSTSSRNPYNLIDDLEMPHLFSIDWIPAIPAGYNDSDISLEGIVESRLIAEDGTYNVETSEIEVELGEISTLIDKYKLILGDYKSTANAGYVPVYNGTGLTAYASDMNTFLKTKQVSTFISEGSDF